MPQIFFQLDSKYVFPVLKSAKRDANARTAENILPDSPWNTLGFFPVY